MTKVLWIEDEVLFNYDAKAIATHFDNNEYDCVFIFGDSLRSVADCNRASRYFETLDKFTTFFVLSVTDMYNGSRSDSRRSLRKADLALFSSGMKVFLYVEDVDYKEPIEQIAWVVGEKHQKATHVMGNVKLTVYDMSTFL
jgi:hypothetical protein